MAGSRYEYVRQFETHSTILPHSYFIIRLDGRHFSSFTSLHNFQKPNDLRSLSLLNASAATLMKQFPDILLAFTQSDEISFLFHPKSTLFNRREAKLLSTIVSIFTSAFVISWPDFFPDTPLKSMPAFDGRIVCYPLRQQIRDYFSWRQVDVHINNQYNTCFWNLVQKEGMTPKEANQILKGTLASDKNELLFRRFGINYAKEPAIFRKGSVIIKRATKRMDGGMGNANGRDANGVDASNGEEEEAEVLFETKKSMIVALHEDIIGPKFWNKYPSLIGPEPVAVSNNVEKVA